MMSMSRRLPVFVLSLAASLVGGTAHAQNYRPDAEAYPCDDARALAIVQDRQGFAIVHAETRKPEAVPAPAVKPTVEDPIGKLIAIGSALRLDRSIFGPADRRKENADAAAR